MSVKKLNSLLNKACEIIDSLEGYADDELKKEIEQFFVDVLKLDEPDVSIPTQQSADLEAQDWEVFGDKKI